MPDKIPGLPEVIDALGDVSAGLDGIPAPIKRNLLKAVGALITGAVEVPVAYFNMKAAEFASREHGHRVVMAAAARNAAAQAGISSEIGDRALAYFASDLVREQGNREAVAREAVEACQHLSIDVSDKEEASSIDDDWLHQFRKIAASKSNAEVQAIFGRILSGEAHKPGSFSPFTLEVVARLDQMTAQAFEFIASHAIITEGGLDPVVFTILAEDRVNHEVLIGGDAAAFHLQACGLLQSFGSSQINPEYFLAMPPSTLGGQRIIFEKCDDNPVERLFLVPMKGSIAFLTQAGGQLQEIIHKTFDVSYARRLRDGMRRLGVTVVFPDININT